jgi:lipopolysaccharide export system permease protein
MLNVSELSFTIDSLQKNFNKEVKSYADNINQRVVMQTLDPRFNTQQSLAKTTILDNFNNSDRMRILRVAAGTVDGITFTLETTTYEIDSRIKNINQHWIALYDKFVIAYACLLMFFIGAPLGAIIRKGGLGLPIVFAILIFIIFHFINTFGKKVAQQGELSPFLGCWMSAFVLTPFAILLTKRATDDKGFSLNFDWLSNFFNKIFPDKTQPEPVLASVTPELAIGTDEIHNYLNTLSDNPNATLELPEGKVIATIEYKASTYQLYSLMALASNIILLVLFFFEMINTPLLISVAGALGLLLLWGSFKSHQCLSKLGKMTQNNYDIPLIVLLPAGFPFYFLFYVYNSLWLKQHNN